MKNENTTNNANNTTENKQTPTAVMNPAKMTPSDKIKAARANIAQYMDRIKDAPDEQSKRDALALIAAERDNIGAAMLEGIGVRLDTSESKIKAAKKRVRDAGGYVSDADSPLIPLLASMTLDADKTAQDASKRAGIMLSILATQYKSVAPRQVLQADGTYKTVTYKTEWAFLSSLLPSISEKTAKGYVNVARTIYIPLIENPDGNKDIKLLGDMGPGTAMFAASIVGATQGRKNGKKVEVTTADLDARARLSKELVQRYEKKGKLTQADVIAAVKAAKEGDTLKIEQKDGKTSVTSAKPGNDTKAGKVEEIEQALQTIIIANEDGKDGDYYLTIRADKKVEFKKLLQEAIKNGDTFAAGLYRVMNRK